MPPPVMLLRLFLPLVTDHVLRFIGQIYTVASLKGEGGADRPGRHSPGGDTRPKIIIFLFFVAEFRKNTG